MEVGPLWMWIVPPLQLAIVGIFKIVQVRHTNRMNRLELRISSLERR